MTGQTPREAPRLSGIRDRRYTIRYPFAAEAEMIEMDSGKQMVGVTSDISMGGCFICTSKPLPANARGRLRLTRKGETLDAMVVVRIVKPRIGVGVEFFDLEPPNHQILMDWIDALRKNR